MNQFVHGIENTQFEDRTENNMKTNHSTLDPVLDLFGKIGSARQADMSIPFERALAVDEDKAVRTLLWARDIRGGAGERNTTRKILTHLEQFHLGLLLKLIPKIPEYGRFDDLQIFTKPEAVAAANATFSVALEDNNGLAAKWAKRKGAVAESLRKYMGLSPKQYRKLIVGLSDTVEQKMCAKQWEKIDFSKLPSIASARYMTAFHRNAKEAYEAYKAKLVKGEVKINASALFPYDLIRSLRSSNNNDAIIQAQWDALPNYVGDRNILPIVDVSGSMDISVAGNITALDVAVSLGLYLSDKNSGVFKDVTVTFSDVPQIDKLRGSLRSKTNQLQRQDWKMSTNLHAAFDRILEVAVKNDAPAKDMPEFIIILSDMEFNCCNHYDDSAIQMIRRKYEQAGYESPKVIFWNLNASRSTGNAPVRFDERGTRLVSGFSPAIMTSILSGNTSTPVDMMLETIMKDRYNWQ